WMKEVDMDGVKIEKQESDKYKTFFEDPDNPDDMRTITVELRDEKEGYFFTDVTVGSRTADEQAEKEKEEQAEKQEEQKIDNLKNENYVMQDLILKTDDTPPDIEEPNTEYDNPEPSEEEVENIIEAILNQDEEELEKYNYFGDRVIDELIEQEIRSDVYENSDSTELTFQHVKELEDINDELEIDTDKEMDVGDMFWE